MKPLFLLAAIVFSLMGCTNEPEKETYRALPLLRAYPTIPLGVTDSIHYVSAIDTVVHDGQEFAIQAGPVFTEQQVSEVEAMTIPNAMGFRLNELGSEALRQHTRRAIQQRMAIRFRDRWVGFPSIQAEIKNGRFAVLDLTEEEMTAISAAFGSAAQ